MPPAPASEPPPGAGPSEAAAPRAGGLRHLIPWVVATGLFMENLDSTVINTAIPDMARSLHETPLRLTLAITAYLLSLVVFIPISGWVADRFGTRRVFCAAIAVFTLGSALCGLSNDLAELVATRVLQGIGGAMMTPVGRLILVRAFPRNELMRAMNFVTIPGLVGPALGPLLGGAIATYSSWRWIFYINVPIGLAGIALAWRAVEDYRAPDLPRFDLSGFAMVGLALAALQLGLETAGRHVVGWPLQIGIFALSAAGFAVYARHSLKVPFPAVSLLPFRDRSFRISVLFGSLVRIPMGASPFLTPLFLQLGLGFSAFQSGAHTFLLATGAILMKTVAPRLLRRFGFRNLLVSNTLVVALTLGGMALVGRATPSLAIAAFLLIAGFFRSIEFSCLNGLAYADLPPEMMSRATGLASAGQQLAASLGIALASTVVTILAGAKPPGIAAFHEAFAIAGLAAGLATLPFLSLSPADGSAVSGHLPRAEAVAEAG